MHNTSFPGAVGRAVRPRAVALALLVAAAARCGSSGTPTPTAPPSTGSLSIDVGGLPAGASAQITVDGPSGYHAVVDHTTVLSALATGTYHLALGTIAAAQGATWYPDADSSTADLSAGATTIRQFYYAPFPITGAYVPELAPFDSLVVLYMTTREIPAATFALSRNGQHYMSRGYGWLDDTHSAPVPPDALFRLASLTKPLTYAAVTHLIDAGTLSASAPVYPLLGITPLPGATVDPRLDNVTVQNLLDHKGGWDDTQAPPAGAPDWVFQSRTVAQQMGLTTPPTKRQLAQFMMGQPLQHDPGTVYAYSNFGYSLLGLVVEQVTGQSYFDYLHQAILDPIGASDVHLGATLPADRDAREPRYVDPGTTCSVFAIATCATVPWPDGGFYMEAFDSFGGLTASAPAYLTFLDHYFMMGPPRAPGLQWDYTFYGSLPGTFTMARERTDGIDMVLLFDQRADASGLTYDPQAPFDALAGTIRVWPSGAATGPAPGQTVAAQR